MHKIGKYSLNIYFKANKLLHTKIASFNRNINLVINIIKFSNLQYCGFRQIFLFSENHGSLDWAVNLNGHISNFLQIKRNKPRSFSGEQRWSISVLNYQARENYITVYGRTRASGLLIEHLGNMWLIKDKMTNIGRFSLSDQAIYCTFFLVLFKLKRNLKRNSCIDPKIFILWRTFFSCFLLFFFIFQLVISFIIATPNSHSCNLLIISR